MLFVADRIPKELARIVEFLNEQMRPAEVLAVEVEQFANPAGVRTLVPRLVGATERARSVKAVAPAAEPLSETDWLNDLESRFGARARHGVERFIEWLRGHGCDVAATDTQDSLCARVIRTDGKPTWPFFIRRSTGRLEVSLQRLATVPQLRDEAARQEILAQIRSLPAETFNTAKTTGWPALRLEDLAEDDVWVPFAGLAARILEAVAGQESPGRTPGMTL